MKIKVTKRRYYPYFIAFVLLSIFLSSCSSYTAYVNTYGSDDNITNKSFYLVKSEKMKDVSDLEFNEISKWVIKGLTRNGYYLSPDIKKANVIIALEYKVGDPDKKLGTGTIYNYGVTGTLYTNTTSNITYNPLTNSFNVNSVQIKTPSYGITGATPYNYQYTTYNVSIIIEALNGEQFNNNIMQPIWRTEITDENRTNDLRHEIPYYMFAALYHLGKNTGSKLFIKFYYPTEEYDNFIYNP